MSILVLVLLTSFLVQTSSVPLNLLSESRVLRNKTSVGEEDFVSAENYLWP